MALSCAGLSLDSESKVARQQRIECDVDVFGFPRCAREKTSSPVDLTNTGGGNSEFGAPNNGRHACRQMLSLTRALVNGYVKDLGGVPVLVNPAKLLLALA